MSEDAAPQLDIYWSFRSPYSYLATDRLIEISEHFPVNVAMRFVRPLALRQDNFFQNARPQWLPYLFKDVFREGERLGLPVVPPRPDPIAQNLATGQVDREQPFIHQLYDLGLAAERLHGRGLALAREVGRLIWQGTENWHEGDHLKKAVERAGLDKDALHAWAAEHRDQLGATLAANEEEQLKHHWGVPLMVLNDEPFFGQDRIDALVWRLEKITGRA